MEGLTWEGRKKGSFPTERIMKLNSLWRDVVELKKVSQKWMEDKNSWRMVWPQALVRSSPSPMLGEAGRPCQWKLIILTLLPKPLVLAAVRGRTLIVFAKIQPNQSDAKFYKQQYRYMLLALYTQVWVCTLNYTQLAIQVYIQLEKLASEVKKLKGKCLTIEFFRHLPQKDTVLDTSS